MGTTGITRKEGEALVGGAWPQEGQSGKLVLEDGAPWPMQGPSGTGEAR